MTDTIKIKKNTGEWADFDLEKLKQSLRHTQASENLINDIANEVQDVLYDGISTKKIYQTAFRLLNKKTKSGASRYKLKRAVMELGPTGFPFENFVAAIFTQERYETQVGVTLEGKCVKHEVDVVLKKDRKYDLIECKFHNQQGRVNDVKIPLYIQSRFVDIKNNEKLDLNIESSYNRGWIFTNTRFSLDAISFAECTGLNLVSWDYPKQGSLRNLIDKHRLFPITALTTLNKFEKSKLLEEGVVLCRQINKDPSLLNYLQLSNRKLKNVLNNIAELCISHH